MLFSSWFSTAPAKTDLDDIPKKTHCYHIEGFLSCIYFQNAIEVGDRLSEKHPHIKVDVNAYVREQWADRSKELQQAFGTSHRTSPFIYEGCSTDRQNLVGGYTDFAKRIKETYKMNVPLD
ncbi:hypothetical protein DFQ28_001695 [Apophysomyces sp. BC1034]|nr:hypothetical protein DFQ30_002010 [Apophysomyces sp. BC1015]KAG0180181.1 hypothetical protein DFQ29_001126 [Apophysomyces sp. BC1021]KAG0190697.1 hypothetical protein DFQ28_001695 [Apophysomyces sp. BC1034]